MTSTIHDPNEIRPPSVEVGVLGWLHHNLFSSKISGLTTIVLGVILVAASVGFLQWAMTGARWDVITDNMRLFLVGQYPREEIWRVWLTMLAVSLATGLTAGTSGAGSVRMMAMLVAGGQLTLALLAAISLVDWANEPTHLGAVIDGVVSGRFEAAWSSLGIMGTGSVAALIFNAAVVLVAMYASIRRPVGRRWLTGLWLVTLVLTIILLQGFGEAGFLPNISTTVWGGLLLTILLSVVGIGLSFPFGVALAVGRRSNLPAVRWICIAYIELIRAVPLITILFMGFLLFPLFLPEGVRIDNVIRAMGGLVVFSAAYVAENVRGGLQAIPRGQVEAAQAVGLRSWQTNLYVVLPQALRITIPANVGLFISLLKDTTLVAIIGILELLGIGRAVLGNPEYIGADFEVYIFVAAVFFFLSYGLSQASYRLEKELGIGER
jgi:general L-amino acid transport system permease protein